MARPVFAFPNWLDNTYYNVVMGSGNWLSSLPLDNLKLDAFSKVAQSAGIADADLRIDIDLGAPRGSRMFGIPFHNFMLDATYEAEASSAIAFENFVTGAAASAGATSLSFKNTGGASDTITDQDVFTIAGDSTVYKAGTTAAIASGASSSINISPALAQNVSGDIAITCHSGDFSSPAYSTGVLDIFDEIYNFGDIDYTHPSWWTGKPTEEQRVALPFPIVRVFPLVIARYWRFQFYDANNIYGYARLPRLFIAPGWQPSLGISYGAESGFITETRIDNTLGGRRIYGREPVARTLQIELRDLPKGEMMANAFDLQREAGIDKQMFFIFDPDDTALMHRRAFIATMERPGALQDPYFDRMSAAFQLREVVA